MISLPRVEPEPEGPRPAVRKFTAAEAQTGTILLVEDEEQLRDLMKDVLTKAGHTVISRADAKEALTWAQDTDMPPDLLLTDFELRGGKNGLALAQELPDILGSPVPTLILTGDITTSTLQAIARSDHQQIMKPLMPEALISQISDLMLKARSKTHHTNGLSRITLHVIEDDPIIRETTQRLFEAEGSKVITYVSAEDFLSSPRPEGTACLLVDAVLPGMDGVALVALLRSEASQVPAIILTGHGDADMAVEAMKAGASDLIEKPASAADLLASFRSAIAQMEDRNLKANARKAAKAKFANLTPREQDVLAGVLEGKPNKIMAVDLGINQRTVENHRASVMRKTGAESLPALVRLALAAEVQSL
ncbi:response regulator [Roseovarius sp. D0-M9]|uniref:response regulator n=1 Tax=Roseovarius sp. D0-M9 TaxID=3127117 RepID=UPI00300FE812